MAATVATLLAEHPTNPVKETFMKSESSKAWANNYLPISNAKLHVHTQLTPDGAKLANFDAFLPEYGDDTLRLNEPAYPPNYKYHRLYSEADGITWFNGEISNIVLAAFKSYPLLIHASHDGPKHGTGTTSKLVDMTYSTTFGNDNKINLAIGEFKRNLLDPDLWQAANLDQRQQKFSKELRGYAHMYECPQVFCFDHAYLLLLQFRARTPGEILTNCDVDCWVFPRDNTGGTPLRYAIYRLLVQGLRRFQGSYRTAFTANGFPPSQVDFFSGQPFWDVGGWLSSTPYGWTRAVDSSNGAFYWVDGQGQPVSDAQGNILYDTAVIW